LINAGNGGASQQLFVLAQTDPIRVYVSVPEAYAPSIRAGLGAFLELTQYPSQKFTGKVVRTAESIDPGTRTLLTEVDVPNHTGALLPGGYSQAHLQVKVTGAASPFPLTRCCSGRKACARWWWMPIIERTSRDYCGPRLWHYSRSPSGLDVSDWIVLNPQIP